MFVPPTTLSVDAEGFDSILEYKPSQLKAWLETYPVIFEAEVRADLVMAWPVRVMAHIRVQTPLINVRNYDHPTDHA